MNPRVRSLVQWAFIAAFAVFAARYLSEQFQQLDLNELTLNPTALATAQVLYCIGMGLMPLGMWSMHRWFGYRMTAVENWRSFYIAQLSKYLPGGIWSIVGRVVLFRRHGMTPMDSATLTMLEMIGFVVGSGVVGLLSLPVFWPLLADFGVSAVLLLAFAFAAGLAVLLLMRRRWLPMLRGVRIVPFAGICALYMLTWIVLGLAFAMIVAAFGQPLNVGDVLTIIGIHGVAWLIGFVVVIAPGGIGVRDTILAVGLLAFFDMPLPALVSLLARIGWTFAEIIDFLILTLLRYRDARRSQDHPTDTVR